MAGVFQCVPTPRNIAVERLSGAESQQPCLHVCFRWFQICSRRGRAGLQAACPMAATASVTDTARFSVLDPCPYLRGAAERLALEARGAPLGAAAAAGKRRRSREFSCC